MMVNQSLKKEKTILHESPRIYLVSSCLMGLQTRYDGKRKPCDSCQVKVGNSFWIPICPEQLGGLSTPRTAADLVGGDGFDVLAGRAKVITRDGQDVTRQFLLGAEQVLEIARTQQITSALLKSRSPSCGMTPRFGVTAALLQLNGFLLEEF